MSQLFEQIAAQFTQRANFGIAQADLDVRRVGQIPQAVNLVRIARHHNEDDVRAGNVDRFVKNILYLGHVGTIAGEVDVGPLAQALRIHQTDQRTTTGECGQHFTALASLERLDRLPHRVFIESAAVEFDLGLAVGPKIAGVRLVLELFKRLQPLVLGCHEAGESQSAGRVLAAVQHGKGDRVFRRLELGHRDVFNIFILIGGCVPDDAGPVLLPFDVVGQCADGIPCGFSRGPELIPSLVSKQLAGDLGDGRRFGVGQIKIHFCLDQIVERLDAEGIALVDRDDRTLIGDVKLFADLDALFFGRFHVGYVGRQIEIGLTGRLDLR